MFPSTVKRSLPISVWERPAIQIRSSKLAATGWLVREVPLVGPEAPRLVERIAVLAELTLEGVLALAVRQWAALPRRVALRLWVSVGDSGLVAVPWVQAVGAGVFQRMASRRMGAPVASLVVRALRQEGR